MFKKFIFPLILMINFQVLSMEKSEKGKEKEDRIQSNEDELTIIALPQKKKHRRKEKQYSSVDAALRKLSKHHNPQDSYSGQDDYLPPKSPRREANEHCLFLKILPDEMLLFIISEMLIDIDFNKTNSDDEFDKLYVKKVHKSLAPFMLSCVTIKNLIPEAICTFYLFKLEKYDRPQKIELAQDSYTHKHLRAVSFLLTSILRDSDGESLAANNIFLKELISGGLLAIDNHCLCFKLSNNDNDNAKLLTDILLKLKSPEDNFITINTILEMILSSSNNQSTLKHLINLENLEDNDYISSGLMKEAFNGNLETFQYAVENNPEQLYLPTKANFNAIIWAIIGGDYKLLDYIFSIIPIDHLSQPILDDQNLIHYATLYASSETLDILLSRFSSLLDFKHILNLKNQHQDSPLRLAITRGFEDKTLLLIKYGAEIEDLKLNHLLPYSGPSEMLRVLIENQSAFKAILMELNEYDNKETLTIEDIIACCKKCRKAQESGFNRLCILGCAVFAFITYAAEKL